MANQRGEQLNLRDINLLLKTDDKKQINLEMSTKINRDRRELMLNVVANADMSGYPYQISGNIAQLDYALSGIGLPAQGISGNLTSDFNIKNDSVNVIALNNLNMTANESQLQGSITAELAKRTAIKWN
ncbi:hypothetical protein IC611_09915 [Proteus mirabilis]